MLDVLVSESIAAALVDACEAIAPPPRDTPAPDVVVPRSPLPSGCAVEGPEPATVEHADDGRVYIDDIPRNAVAETAAQSPQGGMKKDAGKVPHELLPEDALELIARVLEFGSKKYAPRDWEKGLSYGRVYGAIKRHGKAWFHDREELDHETGLPHLAHLACEALFLLAFHARGMAGSEFDDRPAVTRFDGANKK